MPKEGSFTKEPGAASQLPSGEELRDSKAIAAATARTNTARTKNFDLKRSRAGKVTVPEMPLAKKEDEEISGDSSTPWPEAFTMPSDWRTPDETHEETPSSGTGTGPSEPSDSEKFPGRAIAVTRPASLTGPLLTSEQESYVSTALVDDSIKRLHLQMKRLTFDPAAERPHDKQVDADAAAEVMRAKLACATATSMARLLKTKLDAARLFTKK